MERLGRLPASLLGRARVGALVFSLLIVLAQVPQVDFGAAPGLIVTSMFAMVCLLAHAVLTHARGRTLPWDAVISAGLLVTAGAVLRDPMGVVALSICPLVALLSYGSNRAAVARIVLVSLIIPATLLVSPNAHLSGSQMWFAPSTMGAVMMMMVSGLQVRGIYLLLHQHELASKRSAVLSATGHRLLNCRELADAEALIWQTALDLRALSPGIGVASARLDGDVYVVDAVAGLPESALKIRIHRAAVTGFDTDTERGDVGSIRLPLNAALRWRVFRAGTRRVLLAGAGRGLSGDVTDAFTSLGTHAELAEGNCAAHAELLRQARHDQLTALPNRASLFARLALVVDAARGRPADIEDSWDILMVIDLDDFKEVNDMYGHAAGDELLVATAARLTTAAGSTGLAARFGGDEFALLLTGVADANVTSLAEQVCRELSSPVAVAGAATVTVTVGASVGVVNLTGGMTAADHMRCADIAMYAAKARGKNRVERFDPGLHGEVATVSMMEDHLAHAVANDEIAIEYQPQIDLTTGICTGIDTLPYWDHPVLGRIEPNIFLPLAERTGRTTDLSSHILRLACRQGADLAALPGCADLRITTRIAARQLLDPGLPAAVADALSATGLPGHRLTLEVPAHDLSAYDISTRLHRLAGTGVQIAVDSLGNGPLTALCALPLDQVSFHTDRPDSADPGTELELIAAAARILHLRTNALGVDTAAQHEALRADGISTGQGAHFARPMDSEALIAWLARQPQQHAANQMMAAQAHA